MEQHKKNQVETILLKFVSIIKKTLSKWYVSAKAVLYDAQKNTNSNPELRNRIIFGAILFIVSLIIIGVGGVVFNILVMAIALVTMNEMNNIIIGQQLSLESLQKWKLASFAYAFFPQASIMIIRSQEEQGFAVCLWMLCLIVTVDISGFIVGKKFGKRKILPTISPNKTYAGSIAGLIGAVAVSLFFYAIFRTKSEQSFGVVGFVVLGVFLGIL
jgi:phosphatidate cytidylyltransferase